MSSIGSGGAPHKANKGTAPEAMNARPAARRGGRDSRGGGGAAGGDPGGGVGCPAARGPQTEQAEPRQGRKHEQRQRRGGYGDEGEIKQDQRRQKDPLEARWGEAAPAQAEGQR